MTISYTRDVSQSSTFTSFLRLLLRWRGSIWKAVFLQLGGWTLLYLLISVVYRFTLSEERQTVFESVAHYLNTGLDAQIPLTFMLGFFVTFVVGRWTNILSGIGWIDNAAILFANLIRGADAEIRIIRRTLVRYMVLNQALVLRDISMQVRKRFPTIETLEAAGLVTAGEVKELEAVHDPYSRYWTPMQWCFSILYECRERGLVESDHMLEKIMEELQHFRHGLATLMKYDWLIFTAVRLYLGICLISKQFITRKESPYRSEIDLWLPVMTMIQFFVYFGWMQVAEALLNPLGEDDDDLECNYVIDKNLATGFTLVDLGGRKAPPLLRDAFWDDRNVNGECHITPLYSIEAAKRTVHPLEGSVSGVNLVKNMKTITMVPHKNKLGGMDDEQQRRHIRVVGTEGHNARFTADKVGVINPDKSLRELRRRSKRLGGAPENAFSSNKMIYSTRDDMELEMGRRRERGSPHPRAHLSSPLVADQIDDKNKKGGEGLRRY